MIVPTLFLALGCEEPRNVATLPKGTPPQQASGVTAPTPPPTQQPPVVQPRPILGERTTDIRNADVERQKGAQVATTRITAKDPITLQGNAYVTIIGRASMLNIQKAIDLYHATNDRYPKDFAEFKAEIIDANHIALPRLPYYQEYGYDEKEHKLVVLEYPDRKAAVQKQDDARYGR